MPMNSKSEPMKRRKIVAHYRGIEAPSGWPNKRGSTGRSLLYVDYVDKWECCVAACTSEDALEAALRLIKTKEDE